jgi:hypothetical protein
MSTKLFRFFQRKKNSFTKDGVTTGVQYLLLFIVIFYFMWQGEPKLQTESLAAVDAVSGNLLFNNSSQLLPDAVNNRMSYTKLQLGSSVNRYQSSNFYQPDIFKTNDFMLRVFAIKTLERNTGVLPGSLLFSANEYLQINQVVTKGP